MMLEMVMRIRQKISEWGAWSPYSILKKMPLGEWFGAQNIPVDKCLNKSSHPAPVWTSGNWCYMHDVGIKTVSFIQGTHSDQSTSLLFLVLRAVMASLKAPAEPVAALSETPGSWKQQNGEGCPSVKSLMLSIGLSTLLINMPWGPACFPNTTNHICLIHKPYKPVLPPLIMLCCCVQTLRRDLENGEPRSGWEDLLAIRYSAKQLWCTHMKGADFLNLRIWKSLLDILHVFYVALGEVLSPNFVPGKKRECSYWLEWDLDQDPCHSV